MHLIAIRPPRAGDSSAIAKLLGELGYPSSSEAVETRLGQLALDATAAIWVAELDGRVAGIATAKKFIVIHQSAPVVWLTALVVGETARGRGVGSRLVQQAEEWARQQGASRIALTSALHRRQAHDFYKRLGYEHTGVRLAKSLSG